MRLVVGSSTGLQVHSDRVYIPLFDFSPFLSKFVICFLFGFFSSVSNICHLSVMDNIQGESSVTAEA